MYALTGYGEPLIQAHVSKFNLFEAGFRQLLYFRFFHRLLFIFSFRYSFICLLILTIVKCFEYYLHILFFTARETARTTPQPRRPSAYSLFVSTARRHSEIFYSRSLEHERKYVSFNGVEGPSRIPRPPTRLVVIFPGKRWGREMGRGGESFTHIYLNPFNIFTGEYS